MLASNVEQSWQKIFIPILNKFAIENATDLVACGQDAGIFMFGNRNFQVLANSVDTSKFVNLGMSDRLKVRNELDIDSKPYVIGHVGRFSKVKNHKFMVDILIILKNMNVNYKMIFVGDGPLLDEIKSLVEVNELENYVCFTGLRADIPQVMNTFDVYLFPSQFEGLPVSLLEAQLNAIPCLVSSGVSKESDMGTGMHYF